jgi:sortase A
VTIDFEAQNLQSESSKKITSQLPTLISLVVLGVVLVEFVLSPLFQQRAQHQLTSEFNAMVSKAASAIGQAGVSPLPDTAPDYGSAVAVVQIPKLGLTQVVVEGVSSNFTQSGPGHVPGTVLPGQAGESTILGRRTSFGAPFFSIGSLKPGDLIKVVTVEGPSTYKVIDSKTAQNLTGANTLKLITSTPPVLAFGSSTVTAQLQAKPYPATPKNARTAPSTNQFALMVLLLEVLVVALYLSRGIYRRFGPLIGWLLLAPLFAGSIVALTLALDTLLPATI